MHAAINGIQMHYVVEGAGPPLVIPSLAGTQIYERLLSRNLREQLQLVFIELRAGRSGVGAVAEQSLATLVDDLDAFRRQLGHERIAVLGHSSHCFLAFAYAERYPEHASHVVIVGGGPGGSVEQFVSTTQLYWDTVASPERKALLERRLATLPEAYRQNPLAAPEAPIAWYIANGPRFWHDPRVDSTPLWEGHALDVEVMRHFWGGEFAAYDPWERFPRITRPVFIAQGVSDFSAVPLSWHGVKELLRDHAYHAFERSGHFPFAEEPELFDAALIAWMRASA